MESFLGNSDYLRITPFPLEPSLATQEYYDIVG